MAELTVLKAETSTLSPEGRVVIPASIRRNLGLKPGDVLAFREEGGRVVMSTREAAIAQLQRMFAPRPGEENRSMVDELIAERRAEAARENEPE